MLARLQVSCTLAQILAPLTFVGVWVGEVLLCLLWVRTLSLREVKELAQVTQLGSG